jgi:hypothetical protein
MSIIRPTSGAVETENSLSFNELDGFGKPGASVHRSAEGVDRAVLFGSIGDSIFSVESGKKRGVDSSEQRCRIRLPLTTDRKRKWLKLLRISKRNFENFLK